jgi:hypothetical protein
MDVNCGLTPSGKGIFNFATSTGGKVRPVQGFN